VNTLLPLPNLPSVNLPPLTVPAPGGGGTPPPAGGADEGEDTVTTPPTPTQQPQGIDGTQYAYNTGAGAPRMAPVDTAAAAAFDPARFSTSSSRSYGAYLASGSGGVPGSYDGAFVPVFGQLAGLDGSKLDDAGASRPAPSADPNGSTLSVPALVALVAQVGVFAALVRTHQAHRATTRR
jgi:hypothetical protein